MTVASKSPPVSFAAACAAAAAKVPEFVAFAGGGFGPPQVLLGGPSAQAALWPARDRTADEVRGVLAQAEAWTKQGPEPVSVFLSYEGACTLDDTLAVRPGPSPWPAARAVRHLSGVRFLQTGPDVFGDRVLIEHAPPGPRGPLTLTAPAGAEPAHLRRIERARADIIEGTYYQTNLAHALRTEPMSVQEASAHWAHAPTGRYAAACRFPSGPALFSRSPECLFALDADEVVTQPIKGTRPRGQTQEEDRALRAALLASDKDRAEHVMIVDLLRNDMARVTAPVTVASLAHLIEAPGVFHLESTIRGRLRPGRGLAAVYGALAPGGSITGAPKSTATAAIRDYEAQARGPYTGTLGLFAEGKGAASILIRTMLWSGPGPGELHVGGGIVFDSDPAEEWRETLDKAAGFGAVEVA